MDMKSGSLTIALGATEYKRYPKEEKPSKDNTTILSLIHIYVAIHCVAPIALGGFYSFNGMNFYEYMGKKLHFMFGNKALTYVSTEGEPAIKQLEVEQNEQVKKKGRKAEPETVTADSAVKKQEEFEAMKKKTRNMLLGLVAVIVAAVAGIAAYKACLLYTSRCV